MWNRTDFNLLKIFFADMTAANNPPTGLEFQIRDTKLHVTAFNGLIDGKNFFDLPVKNEEETYEKIIEMSRNNDYTTGNLLDFAYFKENYRLIAIDLSKQTKLKDPLQISFIGKLENQAHGATMLFIIEKS